MDAAHWWWLRRFPLSCKVQNIGVDITFSVFSCLVQEIWHKIHNLVMAESKMVTMETTRCFCDGSISENVQGPNLYQVSCFYEKVNISPQILHISPGLYTILANGGFKKY